MSRFGNLKVIAADRQGFLLRFPFNPVDREKLRTVQGARYDQSAGVWRIPDTSQAVNALKVLKFAWTPRAVELAETIQIREPRLLALSSAKDAKLELPFFGKPLRPFQRAGVLYAAERERVIIGDEMGLGKTIQGLAAAYYLNAFPLLVVVPSSNKYNWAETEIPACLPGKKVVLAGKKTSLLSLQLADVIVTNYEQMVGFRKVEKKDGKISRTIWRDSTKKEVILSPLAEALMSLPLRCVILDEAHRIKEEDSGQTKAMMQVRRHIRYRFLLTGTPVLNRPRELLSLAKFLDRLDELGGRQFFLSYFCGLQEGRFGLEAKESHNAQELNRRMRASFYVRRLKSDVWKDMPAKSRVSYPVDIDNRAEYRQAENELIQWVREQVLKDREFLESIKHLSEDDQRIAIRNRQLDKAIRAAKNERLVRFTALTQITARGKLKATKEWIDNFLESGEKLVVFAINEAIISQLIAWYPTAARITSNISPRDRQANVKRFQGDESCRILIGAMGTSAVNSPAGVGHTLTAASNALFIQLGFNPALTDQCEDRCHRDGQTYPVTAHYLLGHETIDMKLAELIETKRVVIKEVSDGELAQQEAGILDALTEWFANRAAD